MSASSPEGDDRHETLHQISSSRGSSLVSELLSIQRHVEPVEKAHKWAASSDVPPIPQVITEMLSKI